ncbi:DUF4286 family protein [Marinoscillum sp. MHG1-6]|uniref:DUF4286 family protein n=1 Tax=Marinoscillum sp. MHG1-6 TaxID=2959627 RepID=UPI002157ECEC|nr:DUF4286 family protein [Marinoscillum sp. MHG1-6]
MIIYNVTANVEEDIAEEWLMWMREVHIPKTLETGCFHDHKVLRLMNERSDVPGITYAVQYFARDIRELTRFASQHEPGLQQDVFQKYGERVVFFKTLLEEL